MTSGQDKVLDHTRQQLSALFDGELGIDEARFLQKRLEHDRELAASWSRWQLAGDALRGQAAAAAPAGFAGRVASAVAAESRATALATRPKRHFWLPGAALAASVAALAMFMTRQAPDVSAPATPQMEIASTAQPLAPEPLPATPAPEQPLAPAGAAQVAATAVAVAEVPRRAAERRSRAQQQRAATTRVARNEPAPRLVANAGAPSAPVDASANPFAPADAAGAIATRPWPRALLPDAGNAFSVGYGRLQPTPSAFQQYEPFVREPAIPHEPTEPEDLP